MMPIAMVSYLLVSIVNYVRCRIKSKKEFDERTKYKLSVSRINLIASLAMLLLYGAVMEVTMGFGASLLPFLLLFMFM